MRHGILRVCEKCGWVHFGITREDAEEEIQQFNAYYDALSPDQQELLYGGGGKAALTQYEYCWTCGTPAASFRPWKDGDKDPEGHTLQPIIVEEEHE